MFVFLLILIEFTRPTRIFPISLDTNVFYDSDSIISTIWFRTLKDFGVSFCLFDMPIYYNGPPLVTLLFLSMTFLLSWYGIVSINEVAFETLYSVTDHKPLK